MSRVQRYHPLLVVLHWLVAVLILAALAVGFLGLATMSNADPAKIGLLRLHMAGGMLIFVLMALRFMVRIRTAAPVSPVRSSLALLQHYGFYVLVMAMVATGYVTGLLAGLPAIVFAGSGDPLPESFSAYPTFLAHGALAFLLAGCVLWHGCRALYRQFAAGRPVFRRMWFGRRALE